MELAKNQVWEEKQAARSAVPEVYNNIEIEYHPPKFDTAHIEAVKPDIYGEGLEAPASNKKTVTIGRRTLIICLVVLILIIGSLVGGLVGGLTSKKHSSAPQASPKAPPTSSGAGPSSTLSTSAITGGGSSTTFSQSTATRASVATTTVAPREYPEALSTSNLVQNPEFIDGFQYWSDPQHCWESTDDPSPDAIYKVTKIARVHDNDQNPGNPCSLTQTISTVGAGDFVLAFLWGTYWNNSADAAKSGGRLIVSAGGSSSPAVIINTTFSVPGRHVGFPIGSFAITIYEEDFVIDFNGWSGASAWDIGKVQLTRLSDMGHA